MRARANVVSDIVNLGLVAVIRTDKPAQVIPVCEALVAGGISALELTMTIPDALAILQQVTQRLGARALLGMGSILDRRMAQAAIDAGADFLVTPIAKVEVAAAAHAADRAVMLGAYSPTEAAMAHEAGADFVKIFPADNLGPGYMRALRAPMPHLKLVPTGGVTVANAAEFIKAGALALGVGSSLITRKILQESDWTALAQLAGEFSRVVREAKSK